ncbi:serine/threonine-protein phosphatase 4 regulatory subunit 1-like isoform X3 [Patella vulgata]|uniref:serine/threonine-protein phosphatase 4 regulatory subunit 1-like isoform X3 n=1 Tax=Patella vulgata TaxID=6465 RepID=UPI0024A7E66E|nr:serine/threonine-protein phosphatase 4 regulatory subunit 1-like isoform X3 [Patella vulgata]XP_055955389.1 serine/threonine-protein phosphatase 4 regulatory subunit 1-like isoform X3 [Patella vulgata]
MADIDFYQDDADENQDDGYGFDDGYGDEDDSLGPLQRLEKYLESDNIFNRQMVARGLLDTLRTVGDNEDDCKSVLMAMTKLSEDSEPSVRSELMEQVPHVTAYCRESSPRFQSAVPTFILPMVVKYLNDSNNQVRKTSQAALLVLLEQELVDKGDVEEQVVHVILELACPESLDDHRTEAVALMSKMAPLLGKDITERLFLPRYCEMCTDPVFNVRKVCATNFGELCSVVGSDNSEKFLLPKFYYLCEDGVWGARKACAECFMTVSCACAPEVRRLELASVFVNLLCDQSRWVRMAAFQQLGPFISTFADPNTTGLYVNEEGHIYFRNIYDQKDDKLVYLSNSEVEEELVTDLQEKLQTEDKKKQQVEDSDHGVNIESKIYKIENMEIIDYDKKESLAECSLQSFEEQRLEEYTKQSKVNSMTYKGDEGENSDICRETNPDTFSVFDDKCLNENNSQYEPVHIHLDNLESFNSFQFWRSPLPEVDVDFDLVNGTPTNIHVSARVKDEENHKVYSSQMNVFISEKGVTKEECVSVSDDSSLCSDEGVKIHMASVSTVGESSETVDNIGSTHVIGQQINESTLAVMDGVVQDVGIGNSSIGFIDSDLSHSPRGSILSEHSHIDDATLAQQQDIVPQSLLENYLGMVDPSRAQTVDTEITRHCAYNLPAVAYTLGRNNWHVIRNLYEILTQDVQWKVRRTLAFSLHELATILGEEITHSDLVPVLDGFLKDLDEVRIGVLKHFADILRILTPEIRRRYLCRIQEFMTTDNNRNWRFRLELAEQLILVCELFSPADISHHIVQVAIALASDKVSEVRLIAYRLSDVTIFHIGIFLWEKFVIFQFYHRCDN